MSDQRIYKNQALTIQADTNVDISGATELLIKAIKPSGTAIEWEATSVSDLDGVISTNISNDVLDEIGVWAFWAKVTFSDSTWIDGSPHDEEIYEHGSK